MLKKPADAAALPLAGRKILIIVENLPLPFDRRVWQESKTLRAAGAEVSVICPTGKGYESLYEELEGVHIYRHPLPADGNSKWGYLYEYVYALFMEFKLSMRVLKERGFDVIQGCNPPDLIFLVAAPYRLLGKRFVFDHHDINPELYEAKFGKRGLFWRLLLLVERLTFMSATISIATNESYRRIAIKRGKMAPEDIFVVRSGPDLSRVRPVPPVPALRKGRAFLLGYVGVLGEQEGIDLLLHAMDHIVRVLKRDDVQLCIVGGGPSLASLKAMARELELDAYVDFLGRAPDQELFEVLSTADVCVNPDRVNEMNDKSTMNKIVEYMAMGKPIVQFDVTEGRFSAGEASLYARANDPIDLADRIVGLLEDPASRARMGAIGRARVEQELSWDYQAPKLIEAYERLFSK